MVHLFRGLQDSLLLSVFEVNLCDISIITIENSGNLFQSRALGFDVEEEDEDELDSDPNLFLY
jgi:hypothetical protein